VNFYTQLLWRWCECTVQKFGNCLPMTHIDETGYISKPENGEPLIARTGQVGASYKLQILKENLRDYPHAVN
jgi:hypothetical protein